MDGVDLRMNRLHVLHVSFIPLFAELDQFFFPRCVSFESALHDHSICATVVANLNKLLLIIEAVSIGSGRPLILIAVNLGLWRIILNPEHGPHKLLLVGLSLPTRGFQLLNHVEQSVEYKLDVNTKIQIGEL
jgi:hypothetical protein